MAIFSRVSGSQFTPSFSGMINSEASPDNALDRILLPSAADDEGGVRGRVEGVEGADCPGRVLLSGGPGGRTEGDIVPVPGDYYGRSGSESEAVELCGRMVTI
jgi:hypothetical protein